METLRLAIQKKGRLNEGSLKLLKACGLRVEQPTNKLIIPVAKENLELLLVRDDDIPLLIQNDIADIAIIGLNELRESIYTNEIEVLKKLDFAKCRLSIAGKMENRTFYDGASIASSYPRILSRYLKAKNQTANILEISGSVEIAPRVGAADFICDLVSTGSTLRENGLTEIETVLESEAVLIKSKSKMSQQKQTFLDNLLVRICAVLRAKNTKYIMMNAPAKNAELIAEILSPMEAPTIMPLLNNPEMVAIHAATREDKLWQTIEELKKLQASSILVGSVEKVIG